MKHGSAMLGCLDQLRISQQKLLFSHKPTSKEDVDAAFVKKKGSLSLEGEVLQECIPLQHS